MSASELIPIDQILPGKLPVITLIGKPIFPGIFTPIMVGKEPDIQLVEQAISADGMIGLVLQKDDSDEPSSDNLFHVGTAAKIIKKINLPDGGINIFISTFKRFKIKKFISKEPPIITAVSYLDDENYDNDEVKALTRALISEMKQLSENNPLFSEEMRLNMINIDNPGKIADFITSILNIEKKDQQDILETLDVRERMEKVLIHINREKELFRIQKKVQAEINEKIEKSQREYFLREELKAIKQELGMAPDARSSDYQRFREKIDSFQFEGEIKEIVEQELEKFNLMEPSSSEYMVTRNWLDLVCSLPWNTSITADFDIKHAKKVLEEDHYGLQDVKDRIIEYLAVRKLKKDTRGTILCLVGPPGVGKTSIGRSVARALGKQFFRFSVGGMRDEAEIKGHRRTYVGALPGKIIQGLKIAKSRDPVFMIDEIDKMGISYQGDPSSALLEVLDPEQNFSFRDHYLDLPFDISNIFFIVTANTLDTIPRPLLDRMEVIQLPGYVDVEKIEIARHFLIPRSLERNGLGKNQVKYTRGALLAIIDGYAREAGVRNLEKSLDKIHRKIAKSIVIENRQEEEFKIDKHAVEKYLGKPIFRDEELKRASKPGMAIGLAWTSLGGDTLLIEAVANPGKEGFKLTGQMGPVMQESAGIAYTYVRNIAAQKYGIQAEFFESRQIHLHIPEGATPKDGPSAGITMATALLSLVINKRIRDRLAMTGELSLTGQVLPVGGLREKTVAAKRNKIREIIIPAANEKDLDEIPEHVKKGLVFHPVSRMEEVIEIVFGS
ncbi:MAG TPA: endopeptidase La [Rectinema sp.]|jgi:ATP-dependent Lon protease|nr:endopeptidase La [Spirochaetia bacterium]MDI9426807.1 endopeptidase La [Spirochaetota bacterium]NLH89306.1 endopeptidase La [Treponema sp.]OQC74079.1 MAG: Lon protease 1 [Spirochaetes bacterium ADurb.Bin001]HNP92610.1 endopeptidase La [Rectinema sp.]